MKFVLGTVEKMIETGAHDVMVVTGADSKKTYDTVCTASTFVMSVDFDKQLIHVDWGEDY